jgi:uncharacterized protein
MQIWLDQVREEPFNWDETRSVPLEALERPELLALGPVSWRGRVVFAEPGFFLRGRLDYEQTLSCNRCLKPIVEQAGGDVELLILVEPGAEAEGERELEEGDLGVLTVREERLETDPILLEQIQLNIPMKPLCQPDCKGLCSTCGADLNLGPCTCEDRSVDPRWAGLAALKSRLDGEKG